MYASVTLSKTKKPRWFRKESRALKNPKIIRDEVLSYQTNVAGERINETLRNPYVNGEQILREPRPSYVLRVGESCRQDAKVKSRQKHIRTFSEWDVIDELLGCQIHSWEYAPGRYIDWYDFEKDIKKAFPDADVDETWELIQKKITPIEDRILAGFKETEEYRWWLETKALRDQLKAEQAQAKAKAESERRRYEERSRQQYHRFHQQTFTDRSAGSGLISLSQEEIRIIDTCYRAMAVQLHPDKGGDPEDMKILNRLKDKIRNMA